MPVHHIPTAHHHEHKTVRYQPAGRAAPERLFVYAMGQPHQARYVADFCLPGGTHTECGGFDIRTAWGVDATIAEDRVEVFRFAVHARHYPDTSGYGPQFAAIKRIWRPELVAHSRPEE